jgi:hypothetical protein
MKKQNTDEINRNSLTVQYATIVKYMNYLLQGPHEDLLKGGVQTKVFSYGENREHQYFVHGIQ